MDLELQSPSGAVFPVPEATSIRPSRLPRPFTVVFHGVKSPFTSLANIWEPFVAHLQCLSFTRVRKDPFTLTLFSGIPFYLVPPLLPHARRIVKHSEIWK